MIDYPKTLKEARERRYGAWAGEPDGRKYGEGFCAYEVWGGPRGMTAYQCCRRNGYGPEELYCKTHAKILARRTE